MSASRCCAERAYDAVLCAASPRAPTPQIYSDNLAEVRITGMTFNISTAQGLTICLTASGGSCSSSLTDFCAGYNNNRCMYAIFDPLAHTCCATCAFPGANVPDSRRR